VVHYHFRKLLDKDADGLKLSLRCPQWWHLAQPNLNHAFGAVVYDIYATVFPVAAIFHGLRASHVLRGLERSQMRMAHFRAQAVGFR
jgi:hypothetical protein